MDIKVHIDRPHGFLLLNPVQSFVGWVAINNPQHCLARQPQPSAEQPGTEQPGTEQPGTEQPGTEQPGTEQQEGERALENLVFLIDGHQVGVESLRRPDVERVLPDHAVAGFRINVGAPVVLGSRSRVLRLEVRCGDTVVHRRTYLKSRNLLEADRSSPLYFMHIPKTAGTALRQFIDRVFADFPSAFVYGDYPGLPLEEFAGMDQGLRLSRELVFGHYGLNATHAFGAASPKAVTVLREPEKLLESYAAYTRDPLLAFFDNPLVRHVSMVGFDVPYGGVTEAHLGQALEMLERRVYAIPSNGLQEFADGLTAAFGVPRFMVPVINRRAEREAPVAYPVEPLTQHDRVLYDTAVARRRDFFEFLDA